MSGYTPIKEIAGIVAEVRKGSDQRITKDLNWRKQQLRQLIKFADECKDEIAAALTKDLKMDPLVIMSETNLAVEEAYFAIKHLDQWASREKRDVPTLHFPGTACIVREPLGVVLMIAPWNYPLGLLLRPFVNILAAGNACIVKPSEVSSSVSDLVAKYFPKYFDQRVIRVVTGGVDETTELLKQKFDHIIYTGNGVVAKIVMKAAAEHLTPLTLELGGKSPCIVDKNVDIKKAVPRICWGSFINGGQTCIAVDYILVQKDILNPFLEQFKKSIKEFYGDNPRNSKDFGKIITSRHAKRLGDLLKGLDVYYGGEVDVDACYVSPTLVVNPPLTSRIMQEEIFGPIIPILTYETREEAVKFVTSRDKPLASYVFTNDKKFSDYVLDHISAGAAGVNEVIMQGSISSLPFGGVGPSGMGRYYGKEGFDNFSNKKSILIKPLSTDPSLRFPPYTEFKVKWVARLNKVKLPGFQTLMMALVPILAVIAYFYKDKLHF